MSEMNQQILLAQRPSGEPQASDFRWVETAMPEIGDGQPLVRSHNLSLDPYLRGRMSEAKSYAQHGAQPPPSASLPPYPPLCGGGALGGAGRPATKVEHRF